MDSVQNFEETPIVILISGSATRSPSFDLAETRSVSVVALDENSRCGCRCGGNELTRTATPGGISEELILWLRSRSPSSRIGIMRLSCGRHVTLKGAIEGPLIPADCGH